MPAEIFHERFEFLSRQKLLSYEEIARVTRLIVQSGAVKLRLTGGEPLVRQDIEKLIALLAEIDGVEDIAMTTNAVLLEKKAQQIADAGLQRITVSLDSLDEAVFQHMNGGKGTVADVLRGLEAAEAAGLTPIKVNTVVQRNVNEHTIVDLAAFCKDRGYIPRFIEYMDVGTMNGWRLDDVVPAEEIVARINRRLPLEPIKRNYQAETALRYRFKDGAGEIGVIASVTKPFCGACSRMRLSPEGEMFTCLFANKGTDIKTPLRAGASDEELLAIIGGMWKKRTDRYSEERSATTKPREKVEMYYIGG